MAKSKLTTDMQTAICDLLTSGVTVENVIVAVGIGKTTFYEWIAIGEAHINGTEHERMPVKVADRERLANFANAVTQARSNAEILAEQVARGGLESQDETLQSVDEVTEIRLRTIQRVDDNGKTVIEKVPYEYRKITKRSQKRTIPPSADYALKYLSRRNPAKWAVTTKHANATDADGRQVPFKMQWVEAMKVNPSEDDPFA